MAKEIPLTRGKVALVDDEDYEFFSQFKWHYSVSSKRGYAVRWVRPVSLGPQKQLKLHREIMNPPDGYVADHINGDTLDNRRSNLRICTFKENSKNKTRLKSGKSSRFRGVTWDKASGKWMSQIMVDKKRRQIGRYHDEEAALAYDRMALKHFGQFANPNLLERQPAHDTVNLYANPSDGRV